MQSYSNLPPTPGWSLNKGLNSNPNNRMDDSTRLAVGDVDGDGRVELVFASSDGSTLGIFSYLLWNDLTAKPPYDLTYLKNAWQVNQPGPVVQMLFQQGSAPLSSLGAGTSWDFNPGDHRMMADLNGDGADEILIFDPGDLWIGVCTWSNPDSRVEALWSAPNQIPSSAPGGPVWTLQPDNVFFTGRFLAGGADQILVYSPSTTNIGVLAWNNHQLVTLWTGTSTLPSAGSASTAWTLSAQDQFLCARNLGGIGVDRIAVANASTGWIGLLQYDASGLSVLATQTVFESMSALTADVDGDTRDEILAYNDSNGGINLAVYRFNASLGLLEMIESSFIPWGFGGAPYQLSRAHLSGGPQDELLLFAGNAGSNPANLGVLAWNGSRFDLIWKGIAENLAFWAPGSREVQQTGQIGWQFNIGDQYFPADIDGDGADEIVVMNFASGWIGWLKLIGGVLVLQNDASGAVPGWNPALLISAPQNPFPTYQGTEADIYSYISGYAITGDKQEALNGTYGLRHLYGNQNDSGVYSAWISNLEAPPNPHPHDWPADTFEDLRLRLHSEVNGVAELSSMVSNQITANGDVFSQEKTAYETAIGMIKLAPQPGSQYSYWLGAIMDAIIWGVAAAPLGGTAQVMLALLASLYGSTLSEDDSEVTVDDPILLIQQIQFQYNTAVTNSLTQQQQFLGDSVILPVLWYLLNNGWYTPTEYETSLLSARAQQACLLYYYQLLMPLTFNVLVWKDSFQATPFTWEVEYDNNKQYWQVLDLPVTENSYLAIPAGDGTTSNVYLVCAGAQFDSGSNITNPLDIVYPTSDLMTALLELSGAGVFLGTGGWSLSAYPVNVTKPGSSATASA